MFGAISENIIINIVINSVNVVIPIIMTHDDGDDYVNDVYDNDDDDDVFVYNDKGEIILRRKMIVNGCFSELPRKFS